MSSSEPRPFEPFEVRDYEKRRYKGLDQRLVDRREKRILQRMLKSIAHLSQSERSGSRVPRVLDAPCGYGRFAGLVLGFGARLIAADLSHSMVARARETAAGACRRAGFVSGAVADLVRGLPFKENTLDLVLSMRFFHHLHDEDDRLSVLREFARVASAGVILSYYRLNRLHALQRVLRTRITGRKYKISMIPLDQFTKEVKKAGFTISRIVPLFRGLHAQHIVLLRKGDLGEEGSGTE
jgi:SAM-dependent methyltransferase